MKIKILDKMVIKNKKVFLTILGAILIGGIAFSVIQIVIAAPPSPGHSWNQIGDFPSNCGTGQYVYGLGSTLLCGTPTGGGTSYWTLSGSNLYPNLTSYNVGIGTTGAVGYKLNVYGNTRVIGGSITTTYYNGAGGTIYADQLCISTSLGGTNYNCITSTALDCLYSSTQFTASGRSVQTVTCSSGYTAVGGGIYVPPYDGTYNFGGDVMLTFSSPGSSNDQWVCGFDHTAPGDGMAYCRVRCCK